MDLAWIGSGQDYLIYDVLTPPIGALSQACHQLATHIQTLFGPWLNNARYMPDAMRSSDKYRGYRHPFLFGIHYLGGVGGRS